MSNKRPRPGRTLSLGPPANQPWVWMTTTMLGSITLHALGIHARRILDFLLYEHAMHRGQENGNLAAPYKQLEKWGLTAADVRKGLQELYATGFVRLTRQGLRQAGGGEPSRYALTWLPTFALGPSECAPTHDWEKVIDQLLARKIGTVRAVRIWLKEETAQARRGAAKRAKLVSTPQL
jgi:hypothetical protein